MNAFLYLFAFLYLVILIIIAKNDKKKIEIDKRFSSCGIIASIMYIVYLYIVDSSSIYINTIYLAIYIILIALDIFLLRKYAKNSYTIGILILFNIILIFSGIEIYLFTMMITAIELLIYMLVEKIYQKKNGNKKLKINDVPVGFFIVAGNITILVAIGLTKIIM